MKESQYNYYFEKEEFSYFFNGVNKTYFRVPIELGKKIQLSLKSDIDSFFRSRNFGEKLYNEGFIVDDNKNELEDIFRRKELEKTKKDYFLVILPTLNCNFSCWYCIQDHVESVMSDETIDKLKKHIEYMINVMKIESLHIEWFGGEPFMYFNRVIKPIASYAQKICLESNINFEHSATTNGFYLTKDIYSDLTDLELRRFHITLDGNKLKHDEVKYCDDCGSAFTQTLTNINGILSYDPNANLILRINYTSDNLDRSLVSDVNQLIQPANRGRVLVNLKKVWQVKSTEELNDEVKDIRLEFESSGYKVTKLEIITNFLTCYVERDFYNAINFNGEVVKCTASDDLYTGIPYGILDKTGEIKWDPNQLRKLRERDLPKPCSTCHYLPICMGPCPHKNNLNNNTFICKFSDIKKVIPDMIMSYIDSRYVL